MLYWILFALVSLCVICGVVVFVVKIIRKEWMDAVTALAQTAFILALMFIYQFICENQISTSRYDDAYIFRQADKQFQYDSTTTALREQNYRESGFYD